MAHEPRLPRGHQERSSSDSLDERLCCGITICREGRRTQARIPYLSRGDRKRESNHFPRTGRRLMEWAKALLCWLSFLTTQPRLLLSYCLARACSLVNQRLSSDSSPFPLLGPSLVPPPTPWKPLTPFLSHGCTCTPSVQLLLVHSDSPPTDLSISVNVVNVFPCHR